jgi:hypothetical protein
LRYIGDRVINCQNEADEPKKKATHKRTKTHFNFNHINTGDNKANVDDISQQVVFCFILEGFIRFNYD